MSYNLISYLPKRYHAILEMQESLKGQSKVINIVDKHLKDFVNNQFVVTSDEYGVSLRESLLSIMADPANETLEFRKARILNRLQSNPPYTEKFLRQRLDAIIGQGLYDLTVDGENFEIILQSSADNQYWAEEIYITMIRVKPSNMVYINKPLVSHKLKVSEEVGYSAYRYNYKLGVSWNLGERPFADFIDQGVIKLAINPSLTSSFKEEAAEKISTIPTSVLINDTLEITDITSVPVGNTVEVEYTVYASNGLSEITNIKLIGADEEVKSNSNVYIPMTDDVLMRHRLILEEGV